jgi:predicted protein tyrosine phosphatase
MDFIVTDREGIEQGVAVRSRYVVISIRDPDSERPKVKQQSGLRDVLYLIFDDAEPPANDAVILMTPEQARQVVGFVASHERYVDTVVVHCEQGMSRSPAVAAALCKAMGGDDQQFWRNYSPNVHVYQLVSEAHRSRKARA